MFPKMGKKKKSNNRMTDKPHLRWLSTLPCCVCHIEDDTVCGHHLLTGMGIVRGMGLKASDRHTISLCHTHHMELHQCPNGETAYLARHGITSGVTLAERLYAVSGDDYAAHKIIMENFNEHL